MKITFNSGHKISLLTLVFLNVTTLVLSTLILSPESKWNSFNISILSIRFLLLYGIKRVVSPANCDILCLIL